MAVRILEEKIYDGTLRYIEATGLSTDTKPTENVMNGSIFAEVDTGKVYFFNEDGATDEQWVEQFSFQG